jgi:superfamily I DNA/RNA helicase
MKCFAKAHGGVTVVGDPDQSIYGWRSAEVENLNRMATGVIVSLANNAPTLKSQTFRASKQSIWKRTTGPPARSFPLRTPS